MPTEHEGTVCVGNLAVLLVLFSYMGKNEMLSTMLLGIVRPDCGLNQAQQ